MGNAAILRALAKLNLQPDEIILELLFTRLLDAVRSRLSAIAPTFLIGKNLKQLPTQL
jgi:uncharacterized protein